VVRVHRGPLQFDGLSITRTESAAVSRGASSGRVCGRASSGGLSGRKLWPMNEDHLSGTPSVDLPAIVAELQAMAQEELGDRARKATDVLATAEQSVAGLEAAIDRIARTSLVFVDQSRMERLAYAMKARVASRVGLQPPAPRPESKAAVEVAPPQRSRWSWDSLTDGGGCLENAAMFVFVVLGLGWLTNVLT
jgi:hypothetical protein